MRNKSFNLPDDTIEQLAAEKAKTGLSEAFIVRKALEAYWSGAKSGMCLLDCPDSTWIVECAHLAEKSGLTLGEFIRRVAQIVSRVPFSTENVLVQFTRAVNQFKLLGDLNLPEDGELSTNVAQYLRSCLEEYMSRPKQREFW